MSPSTALHIQVFLAYVAIALGLLVTAALVMAILKWAFRREVSHAWAAFRGWLIMVPLVLGSILLGRVVSIVFFTLVAIFGFREFARATVLGRDRAMTGIVYLGIIAVGMLCLAVDPTGEGL